jgi:hypothetical protein
VTVVSGLKYQRGGDGEVEAVVLSRRGEFLPLSVLVSSPSGFAGCGAGGS